MNKQPVYYMQTDPRWSKLPYRVPGETATIGGSGCGPSCAAMLIETLTGKTYTPEDACNWSVQHGYKALNQGTYYSYFVPQFKEFNIACQQLNSSSLYGNSTSSVHDKAFSLLKQGYYLIACMGKGTWTSSGHFIVIWWEDGLVRINDPASTKTERLNGNLQTFKSQVKYYWSVDAREYNNAPITITEMNATGTVTATKTLNVRNGPGTTYSIVGSLNPGATVAITGSANGWYRIQYNGAVAWVTGEYIKTIVQAAPIVTEDDDMITQEQFKTLWLEMRKELQDNDSSEYSDAAKKWITEETKLFEGAGIGADGKPNYMWEDLMTREQFATVLYRFAKLVGLA